MKHTTAAAARNPSAHIAARAAATSPSVPSVTSHRAAPRRAGRAMAMRTVRASRTGSHNRERGRRQEAARLVARRRNGPGAGPWSTTDRAVAPAAAPRATATGQTTGATRAPLATARARTWSRARSRGRSAGRPPAGSGDGTWEVATSPAGRASSSGGVPWARRRSSKARRRSVRASWSRSPSRSWSSWRSAGVNRRPRSTASGRSGAAFVSGRVRGSAADGAGATSARSVTPSAANARAAAAGTRRHVVWRLRGVGDAVALGPPPIPVVPC